MNNRGVVALLGAAVSLVLCAPASAAPLGPARVSDSFDGTPCGVAVHVEVTGANPIIETGHVTTTGDGLLVNTGHVVQRLTTADGRWMEDDFSGPASQLSVVQLPDGTTHYRVVFEGIKEEYRASDGATATDRGRLVVDYVFGSDGSMQSRTEVSAVGAFPIASGQVTFCGFLTEHLG